MNNNLANLYWQVQENPNSLCDRLQYAIDCEANFYRMCDALKQKQEMDDLTRAAWFYQILRFSYGSKASSYSWKGRDLWRDFPTILSAHHRLRGVGVHNKDFEHFIKLMDAPDTFFYCDPPYYGTEDYYDGVVFEDGDHERLRDLLLSIDGKFLLSYNDCRKFVSCTRDMVCSLRKSPGWIASSSGMTAATNIQNYSYRIMIRKPVASLHNRCLFDWS